MGLNLQSLFRRNGLVTGYSGEIFIGIICVFKFIDMLITEIEPVVIFLVYTNEQFVCNETLKNFLMVEYYYHLIIWPLTAQIVFIVVLWQLFRIQKESCKKSYMATDYFSIDHESIERMSENRVVSARHSM